MSLPFTHAIVDDDGEIIRKHRWSAKEAKWHKDQGQNVIKLEVVVETTTDVFTDAFKLVGDCLI